MRVLFVGHCTEAYVGYLNKIVKEEFSEAVTGVFDYNRRGFLLPIESADLFDASFSSIKPDDNEDGMAFKISVLRFGLTSISKTFLLKNLILLRIRRIFIASLNMYRLRLRQQYFTKLINDFKPTIVHFNFLVAEYLEFLNYLDSSVTVILTFWGSDLMTTPGGLKGYEVQLNSLERADKITLQTLDLRTILLSKFGHKFLPKTKVLTFNPLNKARKDLLNKYINERSRNALKESFKVPLKNLCIQVGYSAANTNHHIEIIEILNDLICTKGYNLTVFIPLTYGNNDSYVEILKQKLSVYKIDVRIITDYMSEEKMAQLINLCEIFINLRDNDALNAAMVESLFVQNCVITGAWLPYGCYLRGGVKFFNVDSITELYKVVPLILNDFLQIKIANKANKIIVEKMYNEKGLHDKWISIYKD